MKTLSLVFVIFFLGACALPLAPPTSASPGSAASGSIAVSIGRLDDHFAAALKAVAPGAPAVSSRAAILRDRLEFTFTPAQGEPVPLVVNTSGAPNPELVSTQLLAPGTYTVSLKVYNNAVSATLPLATAQAAGVVVTPGQSSAVHLVLVPTTIVPWDGQKPFEGSLIPTLVDLGTGALQTTGAEQWISVTVPDAWAAFTVRADAGANIAYIQCHAGTGEFRNQATWNGVSQPTPGIAAQVTSVSDRFGGRTVLIGVAVIAVDGKTDPVPFTLTFRQATTVSSLTLDQANLTLFVGSAQGLKVTLNPPDALFPEVTWSSSDPAVASVTPSGQIQANRVGTATIVCQAKVGGARTSAAVTVPVPVLSGTVSHFVGPDSAGPGWVDGPSAQARFYDPYGLCQVGNDLYLADRLNRVIRKVDGVTGAVSTIAGRVGQWRPGDGIGTNAGFQEPMGICSDGTNLYVSDQTMIRQIVIATGEVTTLAGADGVWGYADGTGPTAQFNHPGDLVAVGNSLYVADNNVIRRIDLLTRAVTTVAGDTSHWGSQDGRGASAWFMGPNGLCVLGSSLYISDWGNSTIRKMDLLTNEVTTLAGTSIHGEWYNGGFADGVGAQAQFNALGSITSDGTSLYVGDLNNNALRKIDPTTGTVTTVAGFAGLQPGCQDGDAATAQFNLPGGLCVLSGRLVFTDRNNHSLRQLDLSSNLVSTVTGPSNALGFQDGTSGQARFNGLEELSTDGNSLFAYDSRNSVIRRIDLGTGEVSPLKMKRILLDGDMKSGHCIDGGYLYIADHVRSVVWKYDLEADQFSVLAGVIGTNGKDDGMGASARFNGPTGLCSDGTNLYVIDQGNSLIRKVEIATGTVTTVAGGAWGTNDGVGAAAQFQLAQKICTDGTNLYVADFHWSNNGGGAAIRKVDPATGEVTTLAGDVTVASYSAPYADGTGKAARFSDLWGLCTDGTNLYISDTGHHTIRQVVLATGEVTTLAGAAALQGTTDGTGALARFNSPKGLCVAQGALYVSDGDNCIRIIR